MLHCADLYRETKPIYVELNGIKWKGKRQRFKEVHERELNTFHMADRKLESKRNADGKIPVHAWQQELEEIQRNYQTTYEQYKPLRNDLMKLLRVKNCVDAVLHQQEQAQVRYGKIER